MARQIVRALTSRGNALHEAVWIAEPEIFVGQNAQALAALQELTGFEQKVRVAWPADACLFSREGFVDQQAVRSEARKDVGPKRSPQIVGHNDGVEAAARQWPGRGFKVSMHTRDGRIRRRDGAKGRRILIDCAHLPSAASEPKGVAPVTACQVETTVAGWMVAKPATNPVGRTSGFRMEHDPIRLTGHVRQRRVDVRLVVLPASRSSPLALGAASREVRICSRRLLVPAAWDFVSATADDDSALDIRPVAPAWFAAAEGSGDQRPGKSPGTSSMRWNNN